MYLETADERVEAAQQFGAVARVALGRSMASPRVAYSSAPAPRMSEAERLRNIERNVGIARAPTGVSQGSPQFWAGCGNIRGSGSPCHSQAVARYNALKAQGMDYARIRGIMEAEGSFRHYAF